MESSAVDLSVFQQLKASAGAEFIVELIDTFLEDSPRLIDQMRGALTSGNADTFRRAAHSLKSNSATFGAMHLSELAKELEMLGKEAKLQNAGDRLQAVDTAYSEAAGALRSLRS